MLVVTGEFHWQNEIARTSSLSQANSVLQVLHRVLLFSNSDVQKEAKSTLNPVSTIALHSGHLIKSLGIFLSQSLLVRQTIKPLRYSLRLIDEAIIHDG